MNDWKEEIQIDPERLDQEWVRQASLFGKYCSLLAEANKNLDFLKEELNILDAEIKIDIVKNPEHYELSKVTEGTIQAVIIQKPEHKRLVNKIAETKYEADILLAAVRSLDHKKSALENLVRLHGQNYFAGPEVPHHLKKEWIEDSEKQYSKARIKKSLKKRKGGN